MKKNTIAFFILTVLIAPNLVPLSAATLEELQEQIKFLLNENKELKRQLVEARNQNKPTNCFVFKKDLKIGDKGENVRFLEQVLQKEGLLSERDRNLPLVFDKKIFSAVKKFQEKYREEILKPANLKSGTGYAGSGTRKILNRLYDCEDDQNNKVNIVSKPSVKRLQEIVDNAEIPN